MSYQDLDRPPLSAAALTSALVRAGSLWREVQVVASTGSTNADLAEAARAGANEGLVLVAEEQTAGRGRLGRSWAAPPGSGLTFSVLLRPAVPAARWGLLPLLAGVAVAGALRSTAELAATLKWPNDVLLGERKVAGLLTEVAGDAVVLGVGLNVSARAAELPGPGATSVALAGGTVTDRTVLLRGLLRELATGYAAWQDGADPLPAYRALCATLGRRVVVTLPGGEHWTGTATAVDDSGRLVVSGRALAAGDVVHARINGGE